MKLDDLDEPKDVTDADRGEVFTGQPRMAHRLAQSHGDRLMFVAGRGWFRWDGARWALDKDDVYATRALIDVLYEARKTALVEGDNQLKKDAQSCHSDSGIKGTLSIARRLAGLAFTIDDIDADPYLLNTASGTVDLRTMEVKTHDPNDRITKITRAASRPDGSLNGERWQRFLERVLPDEDVRAFLQRLLGVALLGVVKEQVLAILTGTGANGKGTFYIAVLHALGDYAESAAPKLFMHKDNEHPADEMDLAGKRLVVVSESDRGKKLAEATMKRLTGGDKIKARFLFGQWAEFTPSHTPLLITNHLPQVSGDDPAIWRRMRIVPFDVVIPEEERDPDLEDQLKLEADVILAWALAGYVDYLAQGLNAPDAVKRATSNYQLESDSVARFLADKDRVETGPTKRQPFRDLWAAFEKWCLDEGVDSGSKRSFAQELDRLGITGERDGRARWRVGAFAYLAEDDPRDER